MRRKIYNLKKVKVRQSWSKYNLYQLSRLAAPSSRLNYFQQKWKSKSLTRAYHGEQVREGQWQIMFDRRLRGAVPMNVAYLANSDGSSESAGRGSGLNVPGRSKQKGRQREAQRTPYMHMVWAPLERRLDCAIHRALFASSAMQARQFVLHGGVKVNGKKMVYPGYLLNPGDMFQVDPERVMWATGAPKESRQRRQGRATRRRQREALKDKPAEEDAQVESSAEAAATEAETGESTSAEAEAQQNPSQRPKRMCPHCHEMARHLPDECWAKEPEGEEEKLKDNKETLKRILGQSKELLTVKKENMGAKYKQDFRAFQREVRRVLSRSRDRTILTDDLEAQFLAMKEQLAIRERQKEDEKREMSRTASDGETSTKPDQDLSVSSDESQVYDVSELSRGELRQLKEAMAVLKENPIDPTKPYATPWQPRPYMSAFTFVPRYLEVHPKICAAVYLRHPVARPGLAEVPSPFPEFTNGLAFNWYLRRR